MRLEVETGGVRSRSVISGKMCISSQCKNPHDVTIFEKGLAICTAAEHIGVVHSLICRAGINQ